MEKPQYIDWIVEETGIVIKDNITLCKEVGKSILKSKSKKNTKSDHAGNIIAAGYYI